MRLKLTLKKTLVSLGVSFIFSLTLFLISFFTLFGFQMDLAFIIVIFLVTSVLIYLIWSMFQKEYQEDGEEGEDYELIYDTVEEKDKGENNETRYQEKQLS